jgi:hypothetical protein
VRVLLRYWYIRSEDNILYLCDDLCLKGLSLHVIDESLLPGMVGRLQLTVVINDPKEVNECLPYGILCLHLVLCLEVSEICRVGTSALDIVFCGRLRVGVWDHSLSSIDIITYVIHKLHWSTIAVPSPCFPR